MNASLNTANKALLAVVCGHVPDMQLSNRIDSPVQVIEDNGVRVQLFLILAKVVL